MLVPLSKQLYHVVAKALPKLHAGNRLSIRSYKQDRGITISKHTQGFLMEEDGFVNRSVVVADAGALNPVLKKMMKKEFPRSNKVWVRLEDIS